MGMSLATLSTQDGIVRPSKNHEFYKKQVSKMVHSLLPVVARVYSNCVVRWQIKWCLGLTTLGCC